MEPDKGIIRYKSCNIQLDPKSIGSRSFDWDWWHEDYDGEGDPRCGNCGSLEDCKTEINEQDD